METKHRYTYHIDRIAPARAATYRRDGGPEGPRRRIRRPYAEQHSYAGAATPARWALEEQGQVACSQADHPRCGGWQAYRLYRIGVQLPELYGDTVAPVASWWVLRMGAGGGDVVAAWALEPTRGQLHAAIRSHLRAAEEG